MVTPNSRHGNLHPPSKVGLLCSPQISLCCVIPRSDRLWQVGLSTTGDEGSQTLIQANAECTANVCHSLEIPHPNNGVRDDINGDIGEKATILLTRGVFPFIQPTLIIYKKNAHLKARIFNRLHVSRNLQKLDCNFVFFFRLLGLSGCSLCQFFKRICLGFFFKTLKIFL